MPLSPMRRDGGVPPGEPGVPDPHRQFPALATCVWHLRGRCFQELILDPSVHQWPSVSGATFACIRPVPVLPSQSLLESTDRSSPLPWRFGDRQRSLRRGDLRQESATGAGRGPSQSPPLTAKVTLASHPRSLSLGGISFGAKGPTRCGGQSPGSTGRRAPEPLAQRGTELSLPFQPPFGLVCRGWCHCRGDDARVRPAKAARWHPWLSLPS